MRKGGIVDLVEQTCLSQTPGKKDKRGMNGRDLFFEKNINGIPMENKA
jgi:hypothetical protein